MEMESVSVGDTLGERKAQRVAVMESEDMWMLRRVLVKAVGAREFKKL